MKFGLTVGYAMYKILRPKICGIHLLFTFMALSYFLLYFVHYPHWQNKEVAAASANPTLASEKKYERG
jgi:hypothetical protein